MPRRARSTLRAEIKDVGPLGASIDFSASASVAGTSAGTSPELLTRRRLGFAGKMTVELFGVGERKLLLEM